MQDERISLRTYRIRAGLTQQALADAVHLSVATIGCAEGGRRVSVTTAARLADALTEHIRCREPEFPQLSIPDIMESINTHSHYKRIPPQSQVTSSPNGNTNVTAEA